MPLTVDDVQDVLAKDIVLASEGHKKLVYNPLTQRFHIFRGIVALWAEGERNVNYAVRRYNEMSGGEEASHAG